MLKKTLFIFECLVGAALLGLAGYLAHTVSLQHVDTKTEIEHYYSSSESTYIVTRECVHLCPQVKRMFPQFDLPKTVKVSILYDVDYGEPEYAIETYTYSPLFGFIGEPIFEIHSRKNAQRN